MTEVVVISDQRKTVITKIPFVGTLVVVLFLLNLTHGALGVSASGSKSDLELLAFPAYSGDSDFDGDRADRFKRVSDEGVGAISRRVDDTLTLTATSQQSQKFSNILLAKPFGVYAQNVLSGENFISDVRSLKPQKKPELIESFIPISIPQTFNKTPQNVASLWEVIQSSIVPSSSPPVVTTLPPVTQGTNSILAAILPKLKSPRQAWEDLIENAKSGFKNSYSPFEASATPTPPAVPTVETLIPPYTPMPNTSNPNPLTEEEGDPLGIRSARDSSGWGVGPLLVIKALATDLHKDLFSHVWPKHVVPKTHYPLDYFEPYPFKTSFFKPVSRVLGYKHAAYKLYKEKLRDFALLNYLHKDTKVKDLKPSFKDLLLAPSGPPAHAPAAPVHDHLGWGGPVVQEAPVILNHPVVISDKSLIKHFLKAKLYFLKHLWYKKLKLTYEILKSLPAIVKLKYHLFKALLYLLAHKDYHAVLHLVKIIDHAAWTGKQKFIDVVLKYEDKFPYSNGLGWAYGSEFSNPHHHHHLHGKGLGKHVGSTFGGLSLGYQPAPVAPSGYGGLSPPAATSYSAPAATSYGAPAATSYGAPAATSYGAPAATSYGIPSVPVPSANYGSPIAPVPGYAAAPQQSPQPPKYEQNYPYFEPVVSTNPLLAYPSLLSSKSSHGAPQATPPTAIPVTYQQLLELPTYQTSHQVGLHPQEPVEYASQKLQRHVDQSPASPSAVVQEAVSPNAPEPLSASSSLGSRFSSQLLKSGFLSR